jgi:hypothetical protein
LQIGPAGMAGDRSGYAFLSAHPQLFGWDPRNSVRLRAQVRSW